jgi:putative endonuclease
MFYSYILKLKNNKYYSGYSSNLQKRIFDHKKGKVKATKDLLPIKLEFYAAFRSRSLALKFERYLKSSSGFAFRNKRLV